MKLMQRNRRSQQGQTLIIALLILGVLLILGAVFAGILSRTIKGTQLSKTRGQSNDFAESGIRYAHSQLVNSELGADWRGQPEVIVESAVNITRDPDIYYLRPAAPAYLTPGTNRADKGGPDGMGPYFRVLYRGGRALIRVRYATGDESNFSSQPEGYLKTPGMAHNFLILESVGRQGDVNPNDPSLAGKRGAVQYVNFASQAAMVTEIAKMREYDAKEITGRKLIAFAQIGIIDYARFVTNKHRIAQPLEIGMSIDSGARYREDLAGNPDGIAINAPVGQGGIANVPDFGLGGPSATASAVWFGGSLRANTDLKFVGNTEFSLSKSLGEGIFVSGAIGSENGATVTIRKSEWNVATTSWLNTTPAPVLDSYSPGFSTLGGIFRDGQSGADGNQDARNVGYLTPPTILGSGEGGEASAISRYVKMTRDSGRIQGGATFSGQFGHGEGVYVDNFSDYQTPIDEEGRRVAGGSASLVQDWLNPYGDGVTFRSGWHGPFYIPVGAMVHFDKDGFIVSRNAFPDQNVNERTWRNPDGSDTGLTAMRYRIGYGTDGQIRIVNQATPGIGVAINGVLTPAQYMNGPVFNGVLYFEGNVRVRGVIPTDVQISLVSGRTIYIEGSLLKGVQGNDVTSATPAVLTNGRLNRASKSALFLAAKDYVALNPTMFTGPSSERNASVSLASSGVGGYSPLKLGAPDGATTLQLDLPLSPVSPLDGSTLLPYETRVPASLGYYEWNPAAPNNATGTGARENTNLLLTHALEFTSSGPSNAFFNMQVNAGNQIAGASPYQFETLGSLTNAAQIIWASINNPLPAPAFAPIYGLGNEAWQQSPKFETVQLPLINPAAVTVDLTNNRFLNTSNTNNYELLMQNTNYLELGLTQFGTQASGNYMLARAAAVPMDVRIEASIFAEEGSFFVIPGDWYNTNPNDRRDVFEQRVVALGGTAAARNQAATERLNNFGTTAYAPFFGEPADIKINIIGSIAENMAPPIAQQAEWQKKWGWIPTKQAGVFNTATGASRFIPVSHVSAWTKLNPAARPFTENLIVSYDPMLATGRADGFSTNTPLNDPVNPAIRTTTINGVTHQLPPMPRLPVSPTLAFFGEVK